MNEARPLFAQARVVRFQDIDAAGILFFGRIFEYFHDAYAALLDARGVDLPRVLRDGTPGLGPARSTPEGAWGAPLGHAEADFKAPLRYGDAIAVEIERGEVGRTSLSVLFRVRAADAPERVFCTGKTVHVFIDRTTFRPRSVPDEVRAIFATT